MSYSTISGKDGVVKIIMADGKTVELSKASMDLNPTTADVRTSLEAVLGSTSITTGDIIRYTAGTITVPAT